MEDLAGLEGVRGVAVSPRHTRQVCPRYGPPGRAHRQSQALFRCQRCGFQHNADRLAAYNIAMRAGLRALPQGIVARRGGSLGEGRDKPARMLRVSSLHPPPSESPNRSALALGWGGLRLGG
ncbi:zinc ribbon domain-containing protein [Thermus brockianus]|uniref:zinc ribbon domain-containing protein n=1 Tax=Thermus brockianus TaxID=56956 RepID=UPI0008FD0523